MLQASSSGEWLLHLKIGLELLQPFRYTILLMWILQLGQCRLHLLDLTLKLDPLKKSDLYSTQSARRQA